MSAAQPAPDLAPALASIIRGVLALMARAFCRNPAIALRIAPFYGLLNRAARRFAALMARIAAGKPPRPPRLRPPRPSAPRTTEPKTLHPRLPARKAWLLHAMRDHPERHNAAAFGSHLAHLLAAPGVPEFLAAHPAAHRILNPIRHFLGLPTTRKPRAPRPPSDPLRGPRTPRATRGPRTPRPPETSKPRPRKSRSRSWSAILADDLALHPRPSLKKPA